MTGRRSASWGNALVAGAGAGGRVRVDRRELKPDGRPRSPLSCGTWPTGSSGYNAVAMSTIIPADLASTQSSPKWHIEVIAAKPMAVRHGKIRRLIINIPDLFDFT
jgi:hypothetical protein